MVLFVVLPLLLIVLYALQDGSGHFTFANIAKFFTDRDALATFAVSLEVGIETTLICILLGYPAAWILSNRELHTPHVDKRPDEDSRHHRTFQYAEDSARQGYSDLRYGI